MHPLGELGVTRVAVPVPFAEAGGPANVYAIEEAAGGVALFDSGVGTPVGERTLREGLRAAGIDFGDVRRIFLSHGHVDHYGLARTISEASGAAVRIHRLDRAKVERPEAQYREQRGAWQGYMRRLGVAPEVGAALEATHLETLRLARPVENTLPLEDGETLQFKHFSAQVLHAPGHTPGLSCLWVAAHGLLFSDDHLLERVSPNPFLELGPAGEADKFRSLSTYLRTLEKTAALPVELVLPGHGAPFRDARGTAASLVAFYEKRQAKLLAKLEEGPQDALALVRHAFPRAPEAALFLTLSEVIGNLEVLEDRGLVAMLPPDPVYRWTLAR